MSRALLHAAFVIIRWTATAAIVIGAVIVVAELVLGDPQVGLKYGSSFYASETRGLSRGCWPLALGTFALLATSRPAVSILTAVGTFLGNARGNSASGSATHPHQGDGEPGRIQVPEFVEFAKETFTERFGANERLVPLLLSHLSDPAGYFDRIKEGVEVSRSFHIRSTSLTFRAAETGEVIIPLLAQRKGELVDNLDVIIGTNPGSTLSYVENQGAVCLVVETLCDHIARFTGRLEKLVDDDFLEEVLCLVASPTAANPKRVLQSLRDAVRHSDYQGFSSLQKHYYNTLIRVIEFCAGAYFILGRATVVANERVKIQLKSRVSGTSSTNRLLDALRRSVGLQQRDRAFSLERAQETVSYHFTFVAPKGMYIYDRRVQYDGVERGASMPGHVRRTFPDEQLSHGPKTLHVYLRDNGATDDVDVVPTLLVGLRERPPGMIEVAGLLSVALAVTTWLVGLYHDEVFVPESGPPGAWPTLLFGLPTILIGWLLSRLDQDSLSRLSFPSLVLMGWLAANAFAAVLLAGIKSAGISGTSGAFDFLGYRVTHGYWSFLMVSVVAHCASVAVFALTRASRYQGVFDNLTWMQKNAKLGRISK